MDAAADAEGASCRGTGWSVHPAMTVRDPRAAGLTAESTLTGGGFAASFMGNECCPKKKKN